MFRERVIERFNRELGNPRRVTLKVTAFDVGELGVVVQTDQPNRADHAFVWLPYPPDDQPVPEIALEYASDSGRHSGTYASKGLEKGLPVLKLIVTSDDQLDDVIAYIRAFAAKTVPPLVRTTPKPIADADFGANPAGDPIPVDIRSMPAPKPVAPRREAIPRVVQREVWQRDGGACVQCSSRKLLCFDHIVPFSLGGSNSVRNLQLLCEPCNLSKGNRI